MKNKFKKALPLLLLLMVPLSIYAAMNWEGSPNVAKIKDNLDLIQLKIDNLKTESGDKDETIRGIEILLEQEKALREQKESELAGKQTEIDNKQTEIDNKIAEIEEKNNTIQEKNNEINELKQQGNEWKQKAEQVDGLLTQVEQLKTEKAQLTTNNAYLTNELDQALKDVQEIEAITEGMVNEQE